MENNNFEEIEVIEEEKNFFQKFWECKVALPITILTGVVAAGAGAGIGVFATSKKFKKADAERKAPAEQPVEEQPEEAPTQA